MNQLFRPNRPGVLHSAVEPEPASSRVICKAVAAPLLLVASAAAHAVCPVDNGGQFRVTTAETCTAAQSAYSMGGGGTSTVVLPAVAGAIVNLTSPNVTITYTNAFNSYGIGAAPGATLNASGNVEAVSWGSNGRAAYIAGGTVEIQGNFVATRNTRSQGAGIEIASSTGQLIVHGITTINGSSVDGLRNSGSTHFFGDAVFNASNYTQVISNVGVNQFDGNLTLNATNMNQTVNMQDGRIDVKGNLIAQSLAQPAGAVSGHGVIQSGGTISVVGAATISTIYAGKTGLSISNGVFESGGAAATSAGPSVLLGGDSSINTVGADANALVLGGSNAALVNILGSISATAGDGINATAASGGVTILSTGTISATGAGKAVVRGSPAADSFSASAGKLSGITWMGDGNDSVTLSGTVDLSAAPQFDGGAGTDTFNINGLTLSGFTAATNNQANGINLTQWETIDVQNAGVLRLTGDLFNASNVGVLQLSSSASTLDLQNSTTSGSKVNGSLVSSGMLKLDTVVGDSHSASDVLHITGDTSGSTVVQINNLGGAGALTTGDGILLVQVDGNSAGTFTLPGGTLIVGQYVYTLKQVGKNWYLQSRLNVGSVLVQKQVNAPAGAPAFDGSIPFTLNCTQPAFSQPGSIPVTTNLGTASAITVPAGSICSVTEDSLPPPPAGYSWGQAILPPEGAPMPIGGTQTFVVINTLVKAGPRMGQLVVSKTVLVPNGQSPYSGNIDFKVDCKNPAFSASSSIAVNNNQGSAAPMDVPSGGECTVSETLPAAPTGMEWATPVYVQPAVIVEGQTAKASVTNELKKKNDPVVAAFSVPTLGQWALMLLSVALAGAAVIRLRRSEPR